LDASAGHCSQECAIFCPQLRASTSELALQNTQLVTQGEDLDVLLVVGHG
jgi:hypothetical protein